MLIFEIVGPDSSFSSDDPFGPKLAIAVNQLKVDVDDGVIDCENFSVNKLLDYLQKYDIILDKDDLETMVTSKEPLSDIISNIHGEKIVFAGHGGPEEEFGDDEDMGGEMDDAERPEDDRKVVSQMAKRAAGV